MKKGLILELLAMDLTIAEIACIASTTPGYVSVVANKAGISCRGRMASIGPHRKAPLRKKTDPCPDCQIPMWAWGKSPLGQNILRCRECKRYCYTGQKLREKKKRTNYPPKKQKQRKPQIQLEYPYGSTDPLVLMVHQAVPYKVQNREDICQEIICDLLQGAIQGPLTRDVVVLYLKRPWREVSLGQVGYDGRTLGEVLGVF